MGRPRLPPGQRRVTGWPVLHEGPVPSFDPARWRFWVRGEVEAPYALTWEEFLALPRIEVTRDFHCVTTWSRFDNRWEGVPVSELLARARPRPGAQHLLVHSYDAIGYTTNLEMSDLDRPDNLLAVAHDGRPLPPEHGGPVRLVVHHLYAWKSAKWVTGFEVRRTLRRGFWEVRGYHVRGDPWAEERYSSQEGRTARKRVRDLLKRGG